MGENQAEAFSRFRRDLLKKTAALSGALALGLPMTINAGVIQSDNQALNLVARQRMLIYRTFKDYFLIMLGISYKNPQADLKKTEALFLETQKKLHTYFKGDSKIEKLLSDLDTAYKKVLDTVSKPMALSVAQYLQMAKVTFDTADRAVQTIKAKNGKKAAEGIEKAGALRAMSQKINLIYLSRTIDANDPSVKQAMSEAMGLFRHNLDVLHKLPVNDGPIKKKIAKLERIYLYFDTMNGFSSFQPVIITKKAEQMLKTANDLTLLYVKKQGS
ncbi:twin-arginine translocation signal domain-containing protein [Nitratifractor sp.]